jgi:hypothetical protein
MRTISQIGHVTLALISFVVASAFADGGPSGLSAHIWTSTNRVSALSGLEFSIVLTNNGPTNVTIFPDRYVNGVFTITLFDSQGRRLVQRPRRLPRSAIEWRPLRPGESFAFTNKVGEVIVQPGKYHARYGGPDASNVIEITVE